MGGITVKMVQVVYDQNVGGIINCALFKLPCEQRAT